MQQLFETQRLLFREMVPSDAEGIFELDSNPEVHRYLGNDPVTSMEQCHAAIAHIRNQYEKNGIGRWAVILKEKGEFIGWAGLKLESNVNGHDQFYDLGYRFIQKHWGKGYASEAAQAWVDYGFNVMKLEKINAFIDADNIASRKVIEKVGLRFIETFDYEGTEETWYEMKNPNL
jgi:ribosomal-protein-alanine N-acetyltransferase